MKKILKSVLLLCTALCVTSSYAVIRTSVASGNWTTAGTWNGGVPTANDTVIIINGHTVTNNTINTCGALIIDEGGTLNLSTNNFSVKNDVIVSGLLDDSHGSGTNTFNGKFTVTSTGVVTFRGSGSGTNARFKNTITNNGTFSFASNGNRFILDTSSTVKSFAIRGSNPINVTGSGITSLLDTLYIDAPINCVGFRIGTALNSGLSMVVVNNDSVTCSDTINGVLPAIPLGSEIRRWINSTDSYLRLTNSLEAFSVGDMILSAMGNTVEYGASASQGIKATDHYHIIVSGDRGDRDKNFRGTADSINVFGNLIIKNNGARVAFGATGQTVHIHGNVTMEGNAQFTTHISAISRVTNLIIGGSLINNAAGASSFNMKRNDTLYTKVTFTGAGNVISGTGTSTFDTVIFSNPGSVTLDGSQIRVSKALINNTGELEATSGLVYFYDYGNTPAAIEGTSPKTTFFNFQSTDRGDRNLTIQLRVPLTVNGKFDINNSGSLTNGGRFVLNGNTLILNDTVELAANGNNSAIVGDSNAVIVFNGTGKVNGFRLREGGRVLKSLQVLGATDTLPINCDFSIVESLVLEGGRVINGTGSNVKITMLNNSTIIRGAGSLAAAPVLPGVVNVTYTAGAASGPEVPAVAGKLNNLTIDAGVGTVAFSTPQPTVNGNLEYRSGTVTASTFVKLVPGAKILVNQPFAATTLPVGTDIATPVALTVNSIAGGNLMFEIKDGVHPEKLDAMDSYINKFITVSGSATSHNFDMSLTYQASNVTGTEADMNASVWNGTMWSQFSPVDEVNKTVSFTGVTGKGDFTALKGVISGIASNLDGADNINIYPVPAQNYISLSGSEISASGNVTVSCIAMNGSTVASADISTLGQDAVTLDVSSLQPGIYLLKVNTASGIAMKRFVKQ